jgi:hypothetical protein
MNTVEQPKQSSAYPHDTAVFGAINGVKEQSVRARYCRTGSYFGVIPKKLANGRLKWPDVQVEHAGATEENAAA